MFTVIVMMVQQPDVMRLILTEHDLKNPLINVQNVIDKILKDTFLYL